MVTPYILTGENLGNAYHRLIKETVTENGFTYLKLTPGTQALVPKVDRYGLGLSLGSYNYMKILYKTTLADESIVFQIVNGSGLDSPITFTPSVVDTWISAIIPIETAPSSVLNQYHLAVFGSNNASALAGEEFSLGCIGFFEKFSEAEAYMSNISSVTDCETGLGDAYIINSESISESGIITDPEGVLSFSSAENNTSLKMTFSRVSSVGKAQFSASNLTGRTFVKDEYGYVKVR